MRPLGVGNRNHVFDAFGLVDLPADALGDDRRLEALACGVDRRGRAGRSAADDRDIVRLHFARRDLRRAIVALKLIKQLRELGLAGVDHRVAR